MRKEGLTTETERNVRQLAQTMTVASKCGLGQMSARAFLAILNNYANELPGHA
jgi:[NiFe] hydrogenase diaphorase moiety large subunit